jgi:hypothetical protein
VIADLAARVFAAIAHRIYLWATVAIVCAIPSWLAWYSVTPVTAPIAAVCSVLSYLGVVHASIAPLTGCARCERAVPADADDKARDATWTLWFSHVLDARPGLTWLALVGVLFATAIAVSFTGITLLYIPFDVGFIVMCLTTWRHHLLRFACPYCWHGDGGGGWEEIPAPEPDPAGRGHR